jgi:hypothetical protein
MVPVDYFFESDYKNEWHDRICGLQEVIPSALDGSETRHGMNHAVITL